MSNRSEKELLAGTKVSGADRHASMCFSLTLMAARVGGEPDSVRNAVGV